MAAKKKINDIEHIDNKYEFFAYAIKNWWKLAIIIIITGLVISGWKCGIFNIEKESIQFKTNNIIPEVIK